MTSYTQTAPIQVDQSERVVAGWLVVDIETEHGIPASSVVEIIAVNPNDATNTWVGIRTENSSLSRIAYLNEAEDGGNTCIRFLAQVTSNGEIEVYSGLSTPDNAFYIVGYWEGVTFTEQWENHQVGSKEDDIWFELAAANLSLQTDRVHLITIRHQDTGKEQVAGVRTPGSSITRSLAMIEAEGAGYQYIDFFVHTDAFDGNIEIYTEQYDDHVFHNQGYFDSTINFTERWTEVDTINSWNTYDISGSLDQNGRVVDFLLGNISTSIERNVGARLTGTFIDRFIQVVKAEGGGTSGYGMSVQTDGSGQVDLYFQTSNVDEGIWISGYFNVGGDAGQSYYETPEESLNITDYDSTISTWKRILVGTLNTTDIDKISTTYKRKRLDSFGIADFIILMTINVVNLFELLGINDYFSRSAQRIRNLSESLSSIDYTTSVSTYKRKLVDAVSLSDYLATIKDKITLLLETLNISDYTLSVRQFVRKYIKTFNITEYLSRNVEWTKAYLESLNITDSVMNSLSFIIEFIETFDITDFLLKSVKVIFYEALNIMDYWIEVGGEALYKTLSEVLNVTEYLSRSYTNIKNLTEGLDLTDFLIYSSVTKRLYQEAISISDLFASSTNYIRGLLNSLNISDHISSVRQFLRKYIETLSITDTLSSAWSSIKSFYESLDLWDDINTSIGGITYKLINEVLNLTSYVNISTGYIRNYLDSLDVKDYIANISTYTKTYFENISIIDSLSTTFSRFLIQTLNEILNMVDVISIRLTYTRELMESLDITGFFSNISTYSRRYTQGFSLSHLLKPITNYVRKISDSINISDYVKSSYGYIQELYESLTVSLYVSFHRLVVFFESLNLIDILSKTITWIREYTESITITGYKWIGIQFRALFTTVKVMSNGVRIVLIDNYNRLVRVIKKRRTFR